MQQQMLNAPPSSPPNTITTEQIQKYLDENKNLILAILENQNLGKLAECAEYQAQLQKNLMYLAAIADAQPQAPTMPSQIPSHSVVQQGHHMQQPQAAAVQQQPGVFAKRSPFQLNALQPQDQQQHHLHHFQQQQLMQGHMGLRPSAINDMHQAMQTGLGMSRSLMDAGRIRQDGSAASSGDAQGKSASGRGSGDRES
uniref:Putative GRF1-interacting factor 2 n=1 Tax=Davidia involucrata TaxID=16924 RepID=A0A5B7BK87_DAVIN